MSSEQDINNIQHIKKTLSVIFLFEMRCKKLREELEFFNDYKYRGKHTGILIRLNHEIMYLCVDSFSLHQGILLKKSLYKKIIRNNGRLLSKIDKTEYATSENIDHLGVCTSSDYREATQDEKVELANSINKASIQAKEDLQQKQGIRSRKDSDLDQWRDDIQDPEVIDALTEYRHIFAHRLQYLDKIDSELQCPGYTEFNKRLNIVSEVLKKYKEALQTILRYTTSTLYLDSIKGIQYNSVSELQRAIELHEKCSANTKPHKAF